MLRSRLEGDDRVGALSELGIGVLNKYVIKFNKQSIDGSGKTISFLIQPLRYLE